MNQAGVKNVISGFPAGVTGTVLRLAGWLIRAVTLTAPKPQRPQLPNRAGAVSFDTRRNPKQTLRDSRTLKKCGRNTRKFKAAMKGAAK
jgi:hypothetical protein